jgi:hypothetical protein
MSRSPWQTGGKAPRPGEHDMMVYNGLLGFSASSIEDMHREGVV